METGWNEINVRCTVLHCTFPMFGAARPVERTSSSAVERAVACRVSFSAIGRVEAKQRLLRAVCRIGITVIDDRFFFPQTRPLLCVLPRDRPPVSMPEAHPSLALGADGTPPAWQPVHDPSLGGGPQSGWRPLVAEPVLSSSLVALALWALRHTRSDGAAGHGRALLPRVVESTIFALRGRASTERTGWAHGFI